MQKRWSRLSLLSNRGSELAGDGESAAQPGIAAARSEPDVAVARGEQHERRLLMGERLHRRVNAEEARRVVDADTSFPAATRTSPDRTSDLHPAEGPSHRAAAAWRCG
jgi:hypothetical protein